MLRAITVVALFAVIWASPGVSAQDGPSGDGLQQEEHRALRDRQLQMAPVVRVVKAKRMILEVELRNQSRQEFRYLGGNRYGRPVGLLHLILMKHGSRVPLTPMLGPVVYSAKNVRNLPSGQSVLFQIALHDYGLNEKPGNLPPGRYGLWAEYQIGKADAAVQELGITPAEINQLVAIIALVDESDSASILPIAGGLGLLICFVAAMFIFRGLRAKQGRSEITCEKAAPAIARSDQQNNAGTYSTCSEPGD